MRLVKSFLALLWPNASTQPSTASYYSHLRSLFQKMLRFFGIMEELYLPSPHARSQSVYCTVQIINFFI